MSATATLFYLPSKRSARAPRDTVGNNRQNVIQHVRTATSNNPPPSGLLLDGELAIEQADPVRLWVGVQPSLDASGRKLLFDASLLDGGLSHVITDQSLTGSGTMDDPLSVAVCDGGTF
jgi:hypothetical protein